MARTVSTERIREFLSRIWAFQLLEPAHLDLLTNFVTVRNLAPGYVLWLQGQEVNHFTIVFSGQLRSVRGTAAGSERLLSILTSGYHFGLAEMITGATSAVTIIADSPTIVLTIDRRPLRNILLKHAEICFRLMQTMARAIFSLTRELERASFENVHTRLARVLLKGHAQAPGAYFQPQTGRKATHSDLAMQLGVSRETVSRVLADLKKKKLIDTGYRNIRILDRDGLMQYIDDYDQW